MGVGYGGLQFALHAKRRNTNFDRTIMLGRQNHFLDEYTSRALFDRFGVAASDEAIRSMLVTAYSEGLFQVLGASVIDSMDASDYESATVIHDLNKPLPSELVGKYTCVVDYGTLEHVFDIAKGMKTATDLLEVGGTFMSITPCNNMMGHGFYQFSPEFYFNYLASNGFDDIEAYIMLYRNVPYMFRAADPRQVRSRVELCNNEAVQICVLARKVKHVDPAVMPIQSDYYGEFWQGRDVNREMEVVPLDQELAQLGADLKARIAQLASWPETLSPHLIPGFENHRHYQLVDLAKDTAKPVQQESGLAKAAENVKRSLWSAGVQMVDLGRRGIRGAKQKQEEPAPEPTKVEVVEHRGVLIPLVREVFTDEIAKAVRAGTYEAHEAQELDGLIQPGEVILEIGAGCGFLSTYCAKNRHVVEVHCVEANPALIPVIKLTHEMNEVQVKVYHELLGKEDGEADFYVNADFWASGTHSFLGRQIKIPATKFQRRLDEIKPTMLILDIEGGEVDIFDGIDLTGVKKIMMELHQPTIGRRGVKKLFDQLSAKDFHYDMWHCCRSIVTFSHVDR